MKTVSVSLPSLSVAWNVAVKSPSGLALFHVNVPVAVPALVAPVKVAPRGLGEALLASKICSYAQGFQLLKNASDTYEWELNLGEIALLWREGCIIRAQFLNRIKEAYDRNPDLDNLMLDSYFSEVLHRAQEGWRRVICLAIENGIPVSSFSSALAYFDGYRRETLSANMIQAQRDYFGAHTYERTDKDGIFHTDWLKA